MNTVHKISILAFSFLFILALSACNMQSGIYIIDAKTATGIDEKLMPIKALGNFPKDTSKVFCWFQWKNSQPDTEIMASWHFVTDDVHILDYSFAIPRKDGVGSVSLAMPENKNLPPGLYRVQLKTKQQLLKSVGFTVSDK
jgi:hypothetical protein